MIGLTISASKSEVVLFSRKHLQPVVSIRINGRLLPQSMSFKYLGVFYDTGLRWGTQVKYVHKRCLQRLNFLKSIAGVWWGAHPRCMLLLYKGLIGSVLDYASVCYSGMADTYASFGKGSVSWHKTGFGTHVLHSQWYPTFAGKICLLELQIPYCGVLSAGPSFERKTGGSGNNEHKPLYSGVFQCFVDGYNSVWVLYET
jgi:hypothetical protein